MSKLAAGTLVSCFCCCCCWDRIFLFCDIGSIILSICFAWLNKYSTTSHQINAKTGDCVAANEKLWESYPNCVNVDPLEIGDGECQGGSANVESCGYDGTDCIEFNFKYPGCKSKTPYYLDDNFCDEDNNTFECLWDGGDCFSEKYPDCRLDPRNLNDGQCDLKYNTEEYG